MKVIFFFVVFLMSQMFMAQQFVNSSDASHYNSKNNGNTINSIASTGVVRVFVLAGQSNMQGYGQIYSGSTGAMGALITSFTPTCGNTSTCDFTFNMADTYGDGWNGWTYSFVQNGVVVATHTLSWGWQDTATITLQTGVLCEIIVSIAGTYGSEVSWTVTDSNNNVVASLNVQQENYPSPNTLLDVMENDTQGLWSVLQTGGEWNVLDNAYLHFQNAMGTLIKDKVTIGQGAIPNRIGPELMFAHQLDTYFEDPILIIKTAWGGKSLAVDFRPPSAGGTTGPFYIQMLDIVESVTTNLANEFPEIGLTNFEISGFGWFQGWNDAASPDYLAEYESNLYHLVNDVRSAFGNPTLPVVIASAGQGGYEEHSGWLQDIQDIVAVAQENVGCNDSLLGGTVGFVNSKNFYLGVSESPDSEIHHYNNNALTFLNVGKSMGDQMILAINDMAYCPSLSEPSVNDKPNRISVYPNPASNTISIDMRSLMNENAVIKLYDMSGRVVIIRQLLGSTVTLDVSALTKGVYILECTSGIQSTWHRVVLE